MSDTWLLIENGTVVDGDANPPREGCSVLVRNARIVKLGSVNRETDIPRGADLTVLDARGKTVMPGLIDIHCHMTYGLARTEEEISVYTPPELRTLIAAANIEKVLAAGVTSISQPGGSYFIGVGLREGIRRGLVHGPRMTTAGRYLTTSNGLTDWFPDATGVPESSTGRLTNTPAEMVAEIRRQKKAGVDLIKLADSPFGDFQAFTNDELKMAADLAHQLGLKITIHARGSDEMNAAVEAGFDHIMHGNYMSDETIANLAASRIPLAPTQLFMHHIVEFAKISGSRRSIVDATARMNEATMETLHRAYKAGVKFAMGTDSGFATVPYGEWHARELEILMLYTGMSALEAIQAGTKHGANAMGLPDDLGVLAVGKLADIIVVDGDPLKDIRVLYQPGRMSHVILNGVVQTFPDDIRTRFLRNDYLPHEYGWELLTYDRVFEGGERPRTQLDWSGEQRLDLINDLRKQEKLGAAEAAVE
ncbi:amidohydrolase family protein [Micromonospora zingiberis]|uniref:Amidohydrolase family protein n=1 Tax=Micromonospora zingiberis TaxID=2053011 RepID=A0A4R0GGM3_9ACTN|nr:amidohydrolase family protein [Micromonospora zingiberis]TCB95462.1 amidohydrolase family protein [Micromonospora zingiberis]